METDYFQMETDFGNNKEFIRASDLDEKCNLLTTQQQRSWTY
jgi:hypothetical protein